MAENPLVHVPAAWPVLERVTALQRRVVGRLRSFDIVRWPDVPYGDDPLQRASIWELDDLAPRDGWPAVLLLHGGGWVERSRSDFESFAPLMARLGVVTIAVDYRLGPQHRWPAMLDDVLGALDLARGLQIDPERISLWGHSAGGHLALMAAAARPGQVRSVVALGAPSDLRRLQAGGAEPLDQVFAPGQLEAASPIAVVGALPPTLLLHGTLDRVVSIDQARRLRDARPDAVELWELAEGDHGLRWPPVAAMRLKRRAMDWLLRSLEPAARGSKWKRNRSKKKPTGA